MGGTFVVYTALGCNHRLCDQEKNLSFQKIPEKLASRRSACIKATGRTEHGKNKFVVSEHTSVCGAHFVKGKKSTDPSDVHYVSRQNLPQPTLKLTPTKPIVCFNRMSYTASQASQVCFNSMMVILHETLALSASRVWRSYCTALQPCLF